MPNGVLLLRDLQAKLNKRARVILRGKLEFSAVLGNRKGVYSLKMSDNHTR